uniref:TAFII55_N domain-containing protein n=1 Tax=Macrostomum lignano TaxID=282301 RepID=A0A1I8F1Y7_9PLAT
METDTAPAAAAAPAPAPAAGGGLKRKRQQQQQADAAAADIEMLPPLAKRSRPHDGHLQKGADLVDAFVKGFQIGDALALVRLDDLYIDTFTVADVKPSLKGDHVSPRNRPVWRPHSGSPPSKVYGNMHARASKAAAKWTRIPQQAATCSSRTASRSRDRQPLLPRHRQRRLKANLSRWALNKSKTLWLSSSRFFNWFYWACNQNLGKDGRLAGYLVPRGCHDDSVISLCSLPAMFRLRKPAGQLLLTRVVRLLAAA